jgi:short-subunit dehydrogenase
MDRKYTLLEHVLFPAPKLSRETLTSHCLNKTLLITGASYGIGESLCYLLADTHAHLILVARSGDKLAQLKHMLEGRSVRVTLFPTDLSDSDQVAQLIQRLQALENGIDIFINNAGKSICRSLFATLDRFHDIERTTALNYFAPTRLSLALIPMLKQRRGQIISVSGANLLITPMPYWSAYQASKSAFDQWLRCAAPELNQCGIAVSTLYLPLVRTRMMMPNRAYQNMPAMSSQHAAKLICRLIVSRKATFTPWWLFGGRFASLCFGRLWQKLVLKFMHKSAQC